MGRVKPVTLMDLATIGAKKLKKDGRLKELDESEEINACSVKINVDVDGVSERLAPDVQERDPQPSYGDRALRRRGHLPGRRHPRPSVRTVLCVSGHARHRRCRPHGPSQRHPEGQAAPEKAGDHGCRGDTAPTATRSAWPPARSAELYHPGYVAKRMEIGAVIGATPENHVVRERSGPRRRGHPPGRPHRPGRLRRRYRLLQVPHPGIPRHLWQPRSRRATRPIERKIAAAVPGPGCDPDDPAVQRLRRRRRFRCHRRAGRRPCHQPGRGAQEVRGPGRHRAGHLRVPGADGRGGAPRRTPTNSSAAPTGRIWRPPRWPSSPKRPG